MSLNLGRTVLCAYCNLAELKKRPWRSRPIEPSAYAPNDKFYYQGVNGRIRIVDIKEKTIRGHIWEEIEGFGPVPTVFTQVLRRFK